MCLPLSLDDYELVTNVPVNQSFLPPLQRCQPPGGLRFPPAHILWPHFLCDFSDFCSNFRKIGFKQIPNLLKKIVTKHLVDFTSSTAAAIKGLETKKKTNQVQRAEIVKHQRVGGTDILRS